ncbi:MAG: HNH endonuclease [Scytonematopsis contorta HA4267-MV1]|jgi:5-methylcytosine-specific restriction endonuclease McrA|nr:HNH endonuclease [Scytonematopsis contorta HA4267-MV1]
MQTNYVFLIDTNKNPLNPVHPARARELLRKDKANVFRMYPFTLILKTAIENPTLKAVELKIDPGSKFTGLALLQKGEIIWKANLEHRGDEIKDDLRKRAGVRRSRRARKTRYRQPRFLNRKRSARWLPPSLKHRVSTTVTWVNRLIKFVPITSIAMELVRFDTQKLQNSEIDGVEYQQGELLGYEVREYLLEKWGRECAYCGKPGSNIRKLEVEHIIPKSKGGSDRVSNLTIACNCCNQKKSDNLIELFLKKKPELIQKIKDQAKAPLKDAACINSTRWALFTCLKDKGLPLETATGGQTKFNRIKNGFDKDHCIDAACVGTSGFGIKSKTEQPLLIKCSGLSSRQLTRNDKYGFPCTKARTRYEHKWQTGDIASYVDGTVGRVVVQSSNRLEIRIGKIRISGKLNKFNKLHRKDGYNYSLKTA